jgi:hypothetical protein
MAVPEIVTKPSIPYEDLTWNAVRFLSPEDAEQLAIGLVAQRATVKGDGKILSWGDFNENPDLLINDLLARVLVSQVDPDVYKQLGKEEHNVLPKGNKIAILSIENSAGYLATRIANEVYIKRHLDRPPRLLRARKSKDGAPPSPAMGGIIVTETVYPITAGDEPRYLVASASSEKDFQGIRILFVVDDFLATGSTLDGGARLGLKLMQKIGVPESELTIIPMAGLGKPEQEKPRKPIKTTATIHKTLTALDVHFEANAESGKALIWANGFPPLVMQNATIADFSQES